MRHQNQNPDADANMFFYMPPRDMKGKDASENGLTPGMRTDFVKDLFMQRTVPSVVVGGINRDGQVRKGSTVIPTLITERPVFNKQNKIIRGSVIDQDLQAGKKRKVLVSHKEGSDWIVLVRTGFLIGPQGLMGDYMDILSNGGDVVPHGSFSFDKKQGAFKLAEGRVEKADFGNVAAEKIGAIRGKKIRSLGFDGVHFDMWRVPVGAIVIVRDVTGRLIRLVGTKEQVQVQDASGYDKFFDQLLADDLAERAKSKPKVPLDAE